MTADETQPQTTPTIRVTKSAERIAARMAYLEGEIAKLSASLLNDWDRTASDLERDVHSLVLASARLYELRWMTGEDDPSPFT